MSQLLLPGGWQSSKGCHSWCSLGRAAKDGVTEIISLAELYTEGAGGGGGAAVNAAADTATAIVAVAVSATFAVAPISMATAATGGGRAVVVMPRKVQHSRI